MNIIIKIKDKSPPERLNFLSKSTFRKLFSRAGKKTKVKSQFKIMRMLSLIIIVLTDYSNENLKVSLFFGAVLNIIADVIYTFVPSDSGRFSPFTTSLTL